MGTLKINSNFTDYYDSTANSYNVPSFSDKCYDRQANLYKNRAQSIKFLKAIGVNAIDIIPVSKLGIYDGDVVVYVDPTLHHGQGKIVVSSNIALRDFYNCMCTKYYPDVSSVHKVLQIGEKRYNIQFNKKTVNGLEDFSHGEICDIRELKPAYMKNIRLPMFSIDYIDTQTDTLATDFNEVEKLHNLNFDTILKSEDVITELLKAL